MNSLLELMRQPWPWYVAGPLISVVMFLLIWFGKSFGVSSNLRTVCSILGAGKSAKYFDFNWREDVWNLVFVAGLIIGGFIASYFLTSTASVDISDATVVELSTLGIEAPSGSLVPESLFSWDSLLSLRGLIMLVGGGFLIGFGTRYAGGCTSGHAISGLSNLQLPSLIAVIGFFIGGLFITWLVFPSLLTL